MTFRSWPGRCLLLFLPTVVSFDDVVSVHVLVDKHLHRECAWHVVVLHVMLRECAWHVVVLHVMLRECA